MTHATVLGKQWQLIHGYNESVSTWHATAWERVSYQANYIIPFSDVVMNQKYIAKLAQRLYSLKAHAVKQTGYSRMIPLYNTFNKSSTGTDLTQFQWKGLLDWNAANRLQSKESESIMIDDTYILFPIEINSIWKMWLSVQLNECTIPATVLFCSRNSRTLTIFALLHSWIPN